MPGRLPKRSRTVETPNLGVSTTPPVPDLSVRSCKILAEIPDHFTGFKLLGFIVIPNRPPWNFGGMHERRRDAMRRDVLPKRLYKPTPPYGQVPYGQVATCPYTPPIDKPKCHSCESRNLSITIPTHFFKFAK